MSPGSPPCWLSGRPAAWPAAQWQSCCRWPACLEDRCRTFLCKEDSNSNQQQQRQQRQQQVKCISRNSVRVCLCGCGGVVCLTAPPPHTHTPFNFCVGANNTVIRCGVAGLVLFQGLCLWRWRQRQKGPWRRTAPDNSKHCYGCVQTPWHCPYPKGLYIRLTHTGEGARWCGFSACCIYTHKCLWVQG